MRIFVTGGTGFIGSHFNNVAVKNNELEIINIVRNKPFSNKNINQHFINLEEFYKKNFKIGSNEPLINFTTFYKPNYVLNDIQNFIDGNITFSIRVFEKFLNDGGKKIYHTRSYKEFLDSDEFDRYVFCKKTVNKYLEVLAKKQNIVYNSFVLYDSFGMSDKRQKFLDLLILSLYMKKPFHIFDNNKQIDLSPVTFISESILKMMLNNIEFRNLCIASFKPLLLSELYNKVNENMPINIKSKIKLKKSNNIKPICYPSHKIDLISYPNIENEIKNHISEKCKYLSSVS